MSASAFGPGGPAGVAAPIAVGNTGAARPARRLGFAYEGTMASYLTVAGQRRDHELWAVPAPAPLSWEACGRRSGRGSWAWPCRC